MTRSFIGFLFVLLTFQGISQKANLPEQVSENIKNRIAGGSSGIVIGIIDKEGPRYYSFGMKSQGGAPVDEHSVFEIGSISKTFTAILLAEEILEGKMKAEDPVQNYLPSTVTMPSYEGQQITLGHLSDHTSSLPRMPSNFAPKDPANPYADYTVDQMYAFLSSCTLEIPVGSEYHYSNLAVGLLGHILALENKIPYEKLLAERITGPLKMESTSITLDGGMKNNLAMGHAMGIEVSNWDLPALAGAGAIRSTAHDMLLYLKANIKKEKSILSNAMQLTHQKRHDKIGGDGVGLGWHISNIEGVEVIHHSGGTGGYRTFAGFRKDKKLGVVVLINSDDNPDDIGIHLLVPETPLAIVHPSIAKKLREILDADGPEGFLEKMEPYKNGGQYAMDENVINALGYQYLGMKEIKKAEAVFEFNMKAFPNSFNVYDSYAEALMEGGQDALAIFYYKKSLELNPGNTNGIDMLAKLGVTYTPPEIAIDENRLETYTGVYELAPGYTITIARKGNQLTGQVTGQLAYEIFPSSENEFYFKIVPATIVFNTENEKVTSMTLSQNGQVYPCKKL